MNEYQVTYQEVRTMIVTTRAENYWDAEQRTLNKDTTGIPQVMDSDAVLVVEVVMLASED